MKTIVFIVGLPGSGKSFLGQELQKSFGGTFLDDPRGIEEVKQSLHTSDLVWIADPHLTRPHVRTTATERLSAELAGTPFRLSWIYFENKPEQCIQNNVTRGREVDLFIKDATREYDVKEEGISLPVWEDSEEKWNAHLTTVKDALQKALGLTLKREKMSRKRL